LQNAWVESVNARLRDGLLDLEELSTLAEAQVLAADYPKRLQHQPPLGAWHDGRRADQSTPDSHTGWTDERSGHTL
jgi:hypothetical protein